MAQLFEGQIRFGIHSGPQHTSYADYVHLWQTVESMGYDWASVFDHFIPIFADPEGPCFEGPTLLAAMAAQTTRLRCGILVVGNTYRNPAILANIAATIDHVSGGRLEWGIGAGWWEMEHEEYGVPFYTLPERIRRLGETAKILKSLWSEHRTSFNGRYYTMNDALCEPKPVQQQLPLWIGGMGEKLTLRVVAKSADGWNTFFMPLEEYKHKLEILEQHCRAVGRDIRDIRKSLVLQGVIIDDGTPSAAARIEAVRRQGREPLVGTAEQIAEQLTAYAALGVGDFILGARPPADLAGLQAFIELVAPLVRKQAATAAARA